jgi:hypothetical protein
MLLLEFRNVIRSLIWSLRSCRIFHSILSMKLALYFIFWHCISLANQNWEIFSWILFLTWRQWTVRHLGLFRIYACLLCYEWGHAFFYLASDQYEPKTRFWLLFKGSLNMFWSLRCRHFVYQFLLSTVNREPGDLNHSCSFQVYQKVALTVVWKRKAQQKTMLEERNVH